MQNQPKFDNIALMKSMLTGLKIFLLIISVIFLTLVIKSHVVSSTDIKTLGVQQAFAAGNCTCIFDYSAGDGCSIETDACATPTLTPTVTTCTAPDPINGASAVCTCSCVDNAPPAAGASIPGLPVGSDDLYAFSDFQGWIAIIQKYIVAFGVITSLLILPYVGVLWASGDPKNMEKATDWFKALIFGLALLLLSGAILRFVGTDILGL